MSDTIFPRVRWFAPFARDIAIGAVASALISFCFFFAAFHGAPLIALGAGAKFPADFLIQAFAVGFFAAFVPVLLTSLRIKSGKQPGNALGIARIVLRAIVFGALSLAIFGLAGFAISGALEGALPWAGAALIKVIFGALIAIVVVPLALRPVLTSP